MTKYFITFGAGSKRYVDAGLRLIKQVKDLDLFDKIILYTEDDLKNDAPFWNKHSEFILKNKRGYGYWIWKPYLIMKTIQMMQPNDILLYLDAGCEIDIRNKELLRKKFHIVKKDKIIGCHLDRLTDREWTKMDLILYMNMSDDKYLNTSQRVGGVNMFLKCDTIDKFMIEWYNIACNYNLLDDTPSEAINVKGFKQHRHDQSIFSLLTKKYDIYSKIDLRDVILIARNKSGISTIK
jgi:hypothetical protein